MQLIKIYDKSFSEITTLSREDFNNLTHSRAVGEIGSAEFTVRLDSSKVTSTSMEKFNRLEVVDEQQVKWVGLILSVQVELDTATVRCRELSYLLKKRLLGASYVANDTIQNVGADILSTINAAEDTGISAGDLTTAIGSVNTTFNYADAYTILKQICKATGNQFYVNTDRELVIAPNVGTDLSLSVNFRFNIKQISGSNILKFRVDDDGDNIVTKAYGKSNALTSSQEDATLKSRFGLIEKFRDFRVVNTQTVLDDFTDAEILPNQYSPQIDLNPNVPDNFEVGDKVNVVIQNSLIDLNDSFQILEKTVQYIGEQKRIRARINTLPYDLAERLSERDNRLELLEKEV